MTILDFYQGGMILFDIDTAYAYEEWLARLISKRLEKAKRKWSFHIAMEDEFRRRRRKYSAADFHPIPGDPLVYIPDAPKMLFLKSRHLHTLRLQVYKRLRRKEIIVM